MYPHPNLHTLGILTYIADVIELKISRWRNYAGLSEWTVNGITGVLIRRRLRAIGWHNKESNITANVILLASKMEKGGME